MSSSSPFGFSEKGGRWSSIKSLINKHLMCLYFIRSMHLQEYAEELEGCEIVEFELVERKKYNIVVPINASISSDILIEEQEQKNKEDDDIEDI